MKTGWAIKKLGEVCELINGKNQSEAADIVLDDETERSDRYHAIAEFRGVLRFASSGGGSAQDCHELQAHERTDRR